MTGRVVFDVNIMISAMLSPAGTPARAMVAAVNGNWVMIRSTEMLDRFFDVSGRPHLVNRLGGRTLNDFAGSYQYYAEPFEPDPTITGYADDAEDDIVLGTAVAGNADVIVTGDKGLLRLHPFRGIAILTASEFLGLIESPGEP
jgi:putative PIN family toxin of toxin-antitoxin system